MNFFYYIFFAFFFIACAANDQEDVELNAPASESIDVPAVSLDKAVRKSFVAKVFTNGKLSTVNEIPMAFQRQGLIEDISVKNGMQVKSGQLLASLKNDQQKLDLRQARLELDESKVELNDQLITQGGKRGDTSSISEEVFAFIKLRSGYTRALLSVQKAELELSKTYLYAPVDGIVANLSINSHGPVLADKPFCILLDRRSILVQCSILETELDAVRTGQSVKIEPVGRAGQIYDGVVCEINPIVSPQGLIEVTLRVVRHDAWLLPGMNVRVSIEKRINNEIVIPKGAVVDRAGRKVVFAYEEHRAKWRYVKVGHENDREVTIQAGLTHGESIIVSGNLNLANDAKVEVRQKLMEH
ncbi:RND family efflux transporter, MFP subunit [Dyadobacter sp. SG02]|uniref:efflux RND transporter periplasmic adaptor subunit n=1 Tax=Dyadobacter sp. SG02 TaxID=1855291 RepID=UPI0008CD56E3|nr:efflux RND transporter periplasmic adaptor subunit [Dyadobacter sp. SG02]SEJ75787.1 RND family efflux transporter, MFP subunit [Dyadobacter sp. SG02]